MSVVPTESRANAVRPAAGSLLHRNGLTGRGVGIAVVDSGVHAPEEFGRRLVTGPDFTVDAGTADEVKDHTGHGTHLASIAAGAHVGVAPGAHIVSLKTVASGGATEVGSVIAAIDWTVAHRHELSVGVLLLAFGADQLPEGRHDPLAAAVARAWRAGLVVVTSAGNAGQTAPLPTPAHIDEVLTVAGAEQVDGRWTLADFSDRGTAGSRPDLAAPGRSIVGTIAPGSSAEDAPEASVVAEGFVRGSGTSQAAAVVAGAAALLLEADGSLTPDEVKHLLCVTAVRMDDAGAGAGALDVDLALAGLATGLFRSEPALAGAWSGLEWAGVSWKGLEWTGVSWKGVSWKGLEWTGVSWKGVSWKGLEWTGVSWKGVSWKGLEWTGVSWKGVSWKGLEWTGVSWKGVSWKGLEWTGVSWKGVSWKGLEWTGVSWKGVSWKGVEWSGASWS